MKKIKYRRILTEILCGVGVLTALCGAGGTPADPPMKSGGIVDQEIRKEQEKRAESRISVEGPFFLENQKAEHSKEELIRNGITYRLISERLEDAVQEGTLTYAVSDIAYELEGKQEPPDTASITLVDERTGKTYERQLRRLETAEKSSQWTDGFSFEITVTGYDSDVFLIGETEIPAGAPLKDYGDEFLRELGLPADCYRIDSVEWDGEAYMENGAVCRNAAAAGQKLVRQTSVKYGGQVRTPELIGKRYVGIYEAEKPERAETEAKASTEEITETEQSETEAEKMENAPESGKFRRWIREHMTVVTVSIFAVIGFLAILWFCLSAGKNKNLRH